MSVREDGEITIIELSGEVDAQRSPEIKSKIRSLIGEGKAKLVVDLAKVKYMDSSGLGVLVSGLKAARKENGDLKLSTLQAEVQNIFELTQLNKVFEIFENQADAIKSF
jgi:anti-sigma B factor antagonist